VIEETGLISWTSSRDCLWIG